MILTNDGDFAQRMTHPSFAVPKTYLAEVGRLVTPPVLKRLRQGVTARGRAGPAGRGEDRLDRRATGDILVKITLHEGRNHIVRRTMEAVGHPVRRLSRTGIGPVRLGTLGRGRSGS